MSVVEHGGRLGVGAEHQSGGGGEAQGHPVEAVLQRPVAALAGAETRGAGGVEFAGPVVVHQFARAYARRFPALDAGGVHAVGLARRDVAQREAGIEVPRVPDAHGDGDGEAGALGGAFEIRVERLGRGAAELERQRTEPGHVIGAVGGGRDEQVPREAARIAAVEGEAHAAGFGRGEKAHLRIGGGERLRLAGTYVGQEGEIAQDYGLADGEGVVVDHGDLRGRAEGE